MKVTKVISTPEDIVADIADMFKIELCNKQCNELIVSGRGTNKYRILLYPEELCCTVDVYSEADCDGYYSPSKLLRLSRYANLSQVRDRILFVLGRFEEHDLCYTRIIR